MQVASTNPQPDVYDSDPILAGSEILPGQIETAIHFAQHSLLKRQNSAGYWAGELRADADVPAGYIPLASH
jgi:hypothetical protein